MTLLRASEALLSAVLHCCREKNQQPKLVSMLLQHLRTTEPAALCTDVVAIAPAVEFAQRQQHNES
jgi:hypothetical protein